MSHRLRTCALCLAAMLVLFGVVSVQSCSSSQPCSSSSCDGSAGDGGTEGGNDASGDVGVPVVGAACANPTITDGGFLALDAGPAFYGFRGAWGGSEAALAYFEGTGPISLKLQRLTEEGQLLANVLVASVPSNALDLGVATDGSVYVVCWTGGATVSVQCASVSIATNAVTPGFATPGLAQGGSVAYGPGGFVVAYGNTSGEYLQALNADASPKGAFVYVNSFAGAQGLLVPTTSGYALGFAGAVTIYRLNAQLQAQGSTTLSGAYITAYGLAATGDAIGADWFDMDSGTIQGGTAATATASPTSFIVDSDAGCPTPATSVGGGLASFAFTWPTSSNDVAYRAYDVNGNALGPAVASPSVGSSCPLQTIIPVGDGFLIVSTATIAGAALAVFHLGCP